MTKSLSRRSFIKHTSQGVAVAVTTSVLGVAESAQASSLAAGADVPGLLAGRTWIHEALSSGMKVLGKWSIDKISSLHYGAVVVLLENASTGEVMRVDVCRKVGIEATVGVESTPNHEFIVMNGGNGRKWTQRRYHLVVRALARMLDNEDVRVGNKTTLMTHEDRLAAHGSAALASNPFDLADDASL